MTNSEQWIQRFMKDHQFRLLENTLRLSENVLSRFHHFNGKPFDEVSSQDIREWLSHRKEKGIKASSSSRELRVLKCFFQYGVEEGMTKHNPVESIPYPRVEDALPHYLDLRDVENLRRVAEGDPRDRAIIELLYASGVRISELVGIEKDDIMWSERTILIKGKGEKERIVCFTRTCEEYLRAYLQKRHDDLPYLFVTKRRKNKGPIDCGFLRKQFNQYTEKLTVKCTPHTLRHTFAAHSAMKGMPIDYIQCLLGHETPFQTRQYARLFDHAQKQKYDEWM